MTTKTHMPATKPHLSGCSQYLRDKTEKAQQQQGRQVAGVRVAAKQTWCMCASHAASLTQPARTNRLFCSAGNCQLHATCWPLVRAP